MLLTAFQINSPRVETPGLIYLKYLLFFCKYIEGIVNGLRPFECIQGIFRYAVMDKYLIAVAEGDQGAFSHLFYTYKDKVYTIALRLTESPVMADEVVQEVFMRLWTRRTTLPEVRAFEDYLFIMTRNYVFTAMKKVALRYRTEDSWNGLLPSSENVTESAIMISEYEAVLQRAVDLLSPQQRQVYLLSRDKELKREEIAAMLQISPETVKTHLARALRSVRTYCSAELGVKLPLALLLFDMKIF